MSHGEPNSMNPAKLGVVGFMWVVFILVNSTINKAPFTKDQVTISTVVLFFLPLLIALMLTIAIVLKPFRRSFLISLLICGLLLFRLYDMTTPLTVLLLFGVLGFIEWYLSQHHAKPHKSGGNAPISREIHG